NPALSEIEGRYADVGQRAPDVVLVAEGFAERFLARSFRPGEAPSAQWSKAQSDADAVGYFRGALRGTITGYQLARIAEPRLPSWARALGTQPIAIHDHTTAQRVWWFARARTSSGSNTAAISPARGAQAEICPRTRASVRAAVGLTPDLLTRTSNKLLYSCAILPARPRH
ncbi:MAG TPA: hypothetical protein VG963_15780, partial [Polyangiaceae bacterium]|nr:hypothetical protein [Polyangiaceae bacterium]